MDIGNYRESSSTPASKSNTSKSITAALNGWYIFIFRKESWKYICRVNSRLSLFAFHCCVAQNKPPTEWLFYSVWTDFRRFIAAPEFSKSVAIKASPLKREAEYNEKFASVPVSAQLSLLCTFQELKQTSSARTRDGHTGQYLHWCLYFPAIF